MKRLSTQQLEAIRKRAGAAIGNHSIRAVYPEKAFEVLSEDIPALLAEVERLRAELAGDGLLTLPDQVDHAREEIARINAKYEDMYSIALWATRRLKFGQHKDFAYDAIERNLGREVERV